MEGLQPFLLPIVMLVVFYFLLIRPQQKRDKKLKDMRSNIKVGDEIFTIGGIQGTIIAVKEDVIVLENGSAKTKLTISKWAVGSVVTKKED